jgi:hypothetical protein
MTNFATMMESQDKPLRRLSPMQRDIFRQKNALQHLFLNFLWTSFLFQGLWNFNWQQFGLMWPTIPQWWQEGMNLDLKCFLTGISYSILTCSWTMMFLPLSKQLTWGSFRIRSMQIRDTYVINNWTRLVRNMFLNTKQVFQIITR